MDPCLDRDIQDSCLIFLDLAEGEKRMRGSTFQSVFSISSGKCPDVDSVKIIKAFSKACNEIRLYEKSTVQNWSMLITTDLMEDC